MKKAAADTESQTVELESGVVVAIAAALLLNDVEGASIGGTIGYSPVGREARPKRLAVNVPDSE